MSPDGSDKSLPLMNMGWHGSEIETPIVEIESKFNHGVT
jgi:hypothetical protein